jgi:hypothetical protein
VHARRTLTLALAAAAVPIIATPALAQTDVPSTTVQALPAAPPPAEKPIPQLDERTAYMVGRNTLKLGILAFEYGIVDKLSIGSDPPAWAARAFMKVLVPNVHLKFQILDRGPIALAVLGAAYYGILDKSNGVSGSLIDVPLSLFASVRIRPRIYLHGEATYIYVRATGTGDLSQAEFNGAAPARAGQLGLMAQFRLTRIFSLTATGRYQVYVSEIPFEGTGAIDPLTTATVSGQLTPAVRHPWEVIGGVAVLWKHFHLIAGAGYGYYFLPGLQIPNTSRTFVPDLSLAVVL